MISHGYSNACVSSFVNLRLLHLICLFPTQLDAFDGLSVMEQKLAWGHSHHRACRAAKTYSLSLHISAPYEYCSNCQVIGTRYFLILLILSKKFMFVENQVTRPSFIQSGTTNLSTSVFTMSWNLIHMLLTLVLKIMFILGWHRTRYWR